jgi:hypothetical protein
MYDAQCNVPCWLYTFYIQGPFQRYPLNPAETTPVHVPLFPKFPPTCPLLQSCSIVCVLYVYRGMGDVEPCVRAKVVAKSYKMRCKVERRAKVETRREKKDDGIARSRL